MKEGQKKFIKKCLWVIIPFLIVVYLFVLLGHSAGVVLTYKTNLTQALLYDEIRYAMLHPWIYVHTYIQDKNPIFILGLSFVLIYFIYVQFKNKSKKDGWEADEKKGYHGTARWAKTSEIFDGKNFIAQSKAEVWATFQASLKTKESEGGKS
ncbi:hypothetical protein [Listeria booriae]|uniref:Conjugal transfer protein n=1 Tax=Listeria booriae TaxID=1552123 RepID=A0A7X1CCR4_9LIST|nr:hypothetical protein [Listeria booriae]MBC1228622.1 hypothetical protein [Listeria booriae]MBC1248110.1 hypothetical protein [Listeria booriae]MBC1492736.1 hypothetical protein [Listeria booriae]MBC1899055.1 hypothetical protein [Listeria booriae]MBC2069292.1 hypothetical protein [Listeria booriae]